jgi:hypothetical protein
MKEISLAKVLMQLRNDLLEAQAANHSKALYFEVSEAEVELHFAATSTDEGGLGLKLWVLDAGGSTSVGETATHSVKLSIKIVDRTTGKPAQIADEDDVG